MRIRALFWGVGGVLLSNGWDSASRRQAARRFGLQETGFEERHRLVAAAFETGRLSLEQYMEQTVFHGVGPPRGQAPTGPRGRGYRRHRPGGLRARPDNNQEEEE